MSSGQADRLRRAQQKRLELGAALAVAPIADPDEALPLRLALRRVEEARVGGLVPDEDALAPAPAPVDFGQRLAEGEDAVVAVEVEAPDRLGIADGAVMGVVEQEREAGAAAALASESRDQRRLVPFVDDDEVGIGQGQVELQRVLVGARAKLRIGFAVRRETGLAVIVQEVLEAPRMARLVRLDLVPLGDQLAQHAAQEMGVAVVPAGAQGMGEIDDPHAMAFSCGLACASAATSSGR